MERETGFEPATPSLEGWRSSQLSYSRILFLMTNFKSVFINWWGGEVSNLRRLTPTDLQSVPFGHSGTSPNHNACTITEIPSFAAESQSLCVNYGATGGTRTPDRLITNQLLYQLSYGGETLWTHHTLATTCLIKQ